MANRLPVANPGGPYAGLVGMPLMLDASKSTDPDGNPVVRARWVITDAAGATMEDITSSDDLKASFMPATIGTFTAKLTVMDSRNGWSRAVSVSIAVKAADAPPPPPAPVDCALSSWRLGTAGPWGPCQSNGTQTRAETWTRTVVTPPANGGAACGPLTETRVGTQACTYVPPVVVPPPTGDGPLARNEHPRFFATQAELPAIGATYSAGGSRHADFQAYVTQALEVSWSEPPAGIWAGRLAMLAMGAARVYLAWPHLSGVAFGPSSNTRAAWGAKAAEWIMAVRAQDATLGQGYWAPTRSMVLAVDWAWEALTPAQRADLLGWFRQIDADAWIVNYLSGPPEVLEGACAANWHNNQHVQGWSLKIAAGLLFHGAGIDDAWCRASYEAHAVVARGQHGYVTKETQRGGTDGSWSQGMIYGQAYDQFPIVFTEACWRHAHGLTRDQHYTDAAAGMLKGAPLLSCYRIRPRREASPFYGLTPLGLKDFHTSWDGSYGYGDYSQCAGLAILQWELSGVAQERADLAGWLAGEMYAERFDPTWWAWTRLLGPAATPRTPTQLGLDRVREFHVGEWHMATGLHASQDDAHLMVLAHRWATDGALAGTFTLDYLGPVIVQPSVGGHDPDASGSFGFANIQGAPEQGRTAPDVGAGLEGFCDEGFKRVYQRGDDLGGLQEGSLADFHAPRRFHRPQGGERATALALDLRRAYNSDLVSDESVLGQPVKFADISRQYVWLPPLAPGADSARLWVFDQSTTKPHTPPFERRVHFYPSGVPEVDGAPAPGLPVRGQAGGDGKTTYAGATRATAAQMGSRLWLRWYCATPVDAVVVHFRRGPDERVLEDAFGQLHSCGAMSGEADRIRPYAGTHRVELIPRAINATESILSVLEVVPAAAGESEHAGATAVGFLAAQQGDAVVAFGLAPAAVGSVTMPASAATRTLRLVLTGLAPGAHAVTRGAGLSVVSAADGAAVTTSASATAEGTLELVVTVAGGATASARQLAVA